MKSGRIVYLAIVLIIALSENRNVDAITLMHSYSSNRLQLNIKNRDQSDLFVVSRDKVSEFKKWIDR